MTACAARLLAALRGRGALAGALFAAAAAGYIAGATFGGASLGRGNGEGTGLFERRGSQDRGAVPRERVPPTAGRRAVAAQTRAASDTGGGAAPLPATVSQGAGIEVPLARMEEEGPPASETAPPPGAPFDLDAAIAAAAEGDSSAAERAAALLTRDRALLATALERLRIESEPKRMDALAAILGRVRHPAVEAAAAEIALGGDAARRIAALEIFARLETPAALPVATALFAGETDAAVLGAAIGALPEPAGFGEEAAAPIVRDLSRLLSGASDPEVRRRAALKLGEWCGPAEEAMLVAALRRDPDAHVRAGAAYGLGLRGRSLGREAIRALAAVVSDRREDAGVRENAFFALQSVGPLPPEAHAAYRSYDEEREGRKR